MIKLKRIYDAPEPSESYRILVDRIWPGGVSKEKARIDLWMKDAAPSDHLRKWFGPDPKRWMKFRRRYRKELRKETGLTKQLKQLEKKHGTLTLVFSARDERPNQAVALHSFLQRRG
jgi:uncharacterized protein YeaO (DUF488 family)